VERRARTGRSPRARVHCPRNGLRCDSSPEGCLAAGPAAGSLVHGWPLPIQRWRRSDRRSGAAGAEHRSAAVGTQHLHRPGPCWRRPAVHRRPGRPGQAPIAAARRIHDIAGDDVSRGTVRTRATAQPGRTAAGSPRERRGRPRMRTSHHGSASAQRGRRSVSAIAPTPWLGRCRPARPSRRRHSAHVPCRGIHPVARNSRRTACPSGFGPLAHGSMSLGGQAVPLSTRAAEDVPRSGTPPWSASVPFTPGRLAAAVSTPVEP
jgi:hypothetical protein